MYATPGNCYWRLNKPEHALTTYQLALRPSPNDALINYWYSLALRSLGRFVEAVRSGQPGAGTGPDVPPIIAGQVGNYS